MKRLDRKLLRPCRLEPIEREPTKQLPGVPEHFNYGIFYHDDHDYMQHIKSANDANDRLAFRIVGIPEEGELATSDLAQTNSREPEIDDEPIPGDFAMTSDVEDDETASELEDDFVQLVGGNEVRDDLEDDDMTGASRRAGGPSSSSSKGLKDLTRDKVLMMERFLYGENKRNDGASGSGSEADSDDEGEFENPDETTVINRQFEKLLLKCKSQSGSASQSVVTGTSIMSEGLQYALSRDTRMLRHRKVKTDALDDLDVELKSKTLTNAIEEQSEPSSTSESEEDQKEVEPDIMSVQDESGHNTAPKFHQLCMPTNPKSRLGSRQVSMESLRSEQMLPIITPAIDPDLLVRKRGESAEERQLRKTAVKQHRSERRQVRKINRDNFRAELDRQPKAGSVRTVTIS